MSIDFDRFLDWAQSRFQEVVVKGDEIKLNSVFCDDRKHHLWCNPHGGKKSNEHGVYHCWKTDNKGSLVGLVMLVDRCTYEEALETLDSSPQGNLADLERRVKEIFNKSDVIPPTQPSGLELPLDCHLFEDLPTFNKLRTEAEKYLESRKISSQGLYLCTRGRYKNRIVIPYKDDKGSIMYYNSRYVGDPRSGLRYLGPPKELGIGKGDVVYAPAWPPPGEKIHITEGEFDAMSLHACGLNSVALGGKEISDKQLGLIRKYQPVLCLDGDEAGRMALPKIASFMIQKGISNISYVRPCEEYKDWNCMLVSKGEKIVREYIRTQERPYNDSLNIGDWEGTKLKINQL